MHREELIVALSGDEVVFRYRELSPYNQGFDSADDKEEERDRPVNNFDFLMVDCGQPVDDHAFGMILAKEAQLAPFRFEDLHFGSVCARWH